MGLLGVREGLLRIVTAVSAYPFYNFRYLKLIEEFSKRFIVHCFAGLRLGRAGVVPETRARVYSVFPFTIPRRVRYVVGPYLSQAWINLVEHDVVWLFDTAVPIHPLLFHRPVVLDAEDPTLVLPAQDLVKQSRLKLVNEFRLLRSRRISKIVVTTEIIKQKFVEIGVDEERIEVIPYGVDTGLFRPSPLPDDPVVLYYGTFQPYRSRLLLEFVNTLSQMRSDVKFLLIGDIPSAVKRRLLEYACSRVEMPGFIPHDQLPGWLQRARVCILPQDKSLGGRLSFKLLEYMASGRPVVATDVDESFPIKESGAGLVTPIDARAMAEAVIRLLEDEELSQRCSLKGIEYAKRFDWNHMVNRYIELFKKVVD